MPKATKLWGKPYVTSPSYRTTEGDLVWMRRHRQAVRFYTKDGRQIGPEQRNVAPAMAYAMYKGWEFLI